MNQAVTSMMTLFVEGTLGIMLYSIKAR